MYSRRHEGHFARTIPSLASTCSKLWCQIRHHQSRHAKSSSVASLTWSGCVPKRGWDAELARRRLRNMTFPRLIFLSKAANLPKQSSKGPPTQDPARRPVSTCMEGAHSPRRTPGKGRPVGSFSLAGLGPVARTPSVESSFCPCEQAFNSWSTAVDGAGPVRLSPSRSFGAVAVCRNLSCVLKQARIHLPEQEICGGEVAWIVTDQPDCSTAVRRCDDRGVDAGIVGHAGSHLRK